MELGPTLALLLDQKPVAQAHRALIRASQDYDVVIGRRRRAVRPARVLRVVLAVVLVVVLLVSGQWLAVVLLAGLAGASVWQVGAARRSRMCTAVALTGLLACDDRFNQALLDAARRVSPGGDG